MIQFASFYSMDLGLVFATCLGIKADGLLSTVEQEVSLASAA